MVVSALAEAVQPCHSLLVTGMLATSSSAIGFAPKTKAAGDSASLRRQAKSGPR